MRSEGHAACWTHPTDQLGFRSIDVMRNRLFFVLIASALLGARTTAAINVPLTVQETLYPGSASGITRTADPVTVGIPLPDDATTGATDVTQLTVTGANVGQFRVLGRWPSGRIKWVLVDTQASLTGGTQSTALALATGGSGNFGGSNLATDNGATISVNTGTGAFTIKKANFNGIDSVVVGGTTVVASGTSQGFVVTGPAPGQTTCGTCTTTYSSANDASSTAVVEENGPAKAVIRASGSHKDASGNSYMNFTVRLYFYKGKNAVKVTSSLRNADYGTSNSFATAYKGHQGYELRLTPVLAGTRNYAIANHTSNPTTGTLTGSDSVYLYQGDSQQMRFRTFAAMAACLSRPILAIASSGIRVDGRHGHEHTVSARLGRSQRQVPVQAFQSASTRWRLYLAEVPGVQWRRIRRPRRHLARQNSQPYYQAWPQWSTHDVYLNFHNTALASPANEFLKFQHYLVGRASPGRIQRRQGVPVSLDGRSRRRRDVTHRSVLPRCRAHSPPIASAASRTSAPVTPPFR